MKAAANAGWEFKSRCLDQPVFFVVGVLYVFEWFLVVVVGGTLQKLDAAKCSSSPGTKKVTCVDSGPGESPKTPICPSKTCQNPPELALTLQG